MLTRIAFVGDVHGQITAMYEKLLEWQERTGHTLHAIVQVGDFGVLNEGSDYPKYWNKFAPAPIPTWVIMGNHEDPAMVRMWQRQPGRMPGFHLIPDGTIADVLGVKVGGIWGNYSPKSWANPDRVASHREPNCPSQSWRFANHIDRKAVEKLITTSMTMDVLVTHDASRIWLPPHFKRPMDPITKGILGLEHDEETGGCMGFDEIIFRHHPTWYFFGHLHYYYTSTVYAGGKNTKVVALNALYHDGGPWFHVAEFNPYSTYIDPSGTIFAEPLQESLASA